MWFCECRVPGEGGGATGPGGQVEVQTERRVQDCLPRLSLLQTSLLSHWSLWTMMSPL